MVHSCDDKLHEFSKLNNFCLKAIRYKTQKCIVISTGRKYRHLLTIYVLLTKFTWFVEIDITFLELKCFYIFTPLPICIFKFWYLFIQKFKEVFELNWLQKFVSIKYIKLKKMKSATIFFWVKRQITHKIRFFSKNGLALCRFNWIKIKFLLYFVRKQFILFIKYRYTHYNDSHVDCTDISHFLYYDFWIL